MIKKLGICGDSFMSPPTFDVDGYGKHFSQKLSKRMGCELIPLSRGAATNFHIRLQIEEIIKFNPDVVIVGTTSVDRLDLPLEWYLNSDPNNRINYKKIELKDISYIGHKDLSSEIIKNPHPTTISQSISTLINKEVKAPGKDLLSEVQIDTVERYFQYLYDPNYKRMIDSFMIADGIRKLIQNNIRFYVLNHMLDQTILDFGGSSVIPPYSDLIPQNYYSKEENAKYPFHTNEDEQDILADKWFEKINNLI